MRDRFLLLSVSRALIFLRKFTVFTYCVNVYYRFKKDAAILKTKSSRPVAHQTAVPVDRLS